MEALETIESLGTPVAQTLEMHAGPAAPVPGGQRDEDDARVSAVDAATPLAADGKTAAVKALAPDEGFVAEDSAPAMHVESLTGCSTPSVLEVRLELLPKPLEASGERGGASVRREGGDADGGAGEGFGGVVAGDFVWGQPKGKGSLWWPGRVFDSTAASEKATKDRPDGGHWVLVAYFGDGSFGWCDPSRLKPFVAEYEQMVQQTGAKSFAKAVASALDEFGRCLELEMSCRCVPGEALLKLNRLVVVNDGLKNGVTVPEGQNAGMAIVNGVPSELLQRFRDLACDVSITHMLEITVIRSFVAAFFRGMGRYAPLPEYSTYKGIPQVKEKGCRSSPFTSTGSPGRGPFRKAGIVDRPQVSEGEGKKQRSMAELIAGMDLDMDDEGPCKSETPTWKRKKKEVESKDSNAVNGDVGAEEGAFSGRRERKKSKYLSPPYTMIAHESKRPAVPKSSEKKMAKKELGASEDMDSVEGKLAEKISGAHSIVRCSANGEEDEKFEVLDAKTSLAVLLLELRLTALNTLYLVGNRFDYISGFFGKFRSSVYNDGCEFDSYGRPLASPSDIGMKTPGLETNGSIEGEEAKTPGVVEGSQPIKHKYGPERKRKSLGHEANGSSEAKPRSHPRKKSVDNVVCSSKRPKSAGSEGTVSAGQEANGFEEDKSDQKRKMKMKKNEEAAQEAHGSEESKPKLKRMRRKNNGEGIQEANGSEEGRPEKKRGCKKKNEEAHSDPGAALLLSFATGVKLPSKEELISTYSKFGTLSESKTELQKDAGCATVVFSTKADAEKAFNCPEADRPFGSALSTFRLQYLQDESSTPRVSTPARAPKPPLEFVKKSLESMITTLSESGLSAKDIGGSAGVLKLDTKENLVNEMSGLLKKNPAAADATPTSPKSVVFDLNYPATM